MTAREYLEVQETMTRDMLAALRRERAATHPVGKRCARRAFEEYLAEARRLAWAWSREQGGQAV